MINTEQLIKKKAVSHDAYNQDSDDELLQEMNNGNGRVGQKKNGRHNNGNNNNNNQYLHNRARQRKKKQYDLKYYDNDSDFSSSSENGGDDEKKSNNIYINKQQSFDKVDISDLNISSIYNIKRQKSALSAIMAAPSQEINIKRHHSHYGTKYHDDDELERNYSKYARYEPEIQHNGGGLFHSFILMVYFGEYINDDAIKLEITAPWTVLETMNKAIQQWRMERAMNKLKGKTASNYCMRPYDDGEIEADEPAFGTHLKIHTLNQKQVGLQYIGGRNASSSINNGYESGPSSIDKKSSIGPSSVLNFDNGKEQILVKVSIPGPNNESHVLAIDRNATALTIRDLISLLNKKKHSAHFHAQYFNFYFNGQTKGKGQELSLGESIIDLSEPRQLVLLPKFLTQNDDINEAYNFNLVRLANEQREYHCTKIRNARKNKKRLLIVDKYRIVKKAMDDYNIGTSDHVPIDILSIIDIHVVDKNNKQFSIEYRKPQHGGTRLQIYELENVKECAHIVKKVRYLNTLRKLQ